MIRINETVKLKWSRITQPNQLLNIRNNKTNPYPQIKIHRKDKTAFCGTLFSLWPLSSVSHCQSKRLATSPQTFSKSSHCGTALKLLEDNRNDSDSLMLCCLETSEKEFLLTRTAHPSSETQPVVSTRSPSLGSNLSCRCTFKGNIPPKNNFIHFFPKSSQSAKICFVYKVCFFSFVLELRG